jgi:ankyrin repeat protein
MLFLIRAFVVRLLLTVLCRVMDKFDAVRDGDLQRLRVALTTDNVHDVDYNGWTVLHLATCTNADCVKHCIEMGANVSARAYAGCTPLHFASWRGHVDAVRVLLTTDAIVDATNDDGRTPLYYAIRHSHADVTRMLLEREAKVSNVKLDKEVPAIPNWVNTFIQSRSNCRCAAITIIAIHKFRRTTMTANNDTNVLRLIAMHIFHEDE